MRGSGVYCFGDAIAMKRVAGAPQGSNDCGDYICWDNVNQGVAPHWAFFKANGQNYDIVGEFCSCGTPATCQHNPIKSR